MDEVVPKSSLNGLIIQVFLAPCNRLTRSFNVSTNGGKNVKVLHARELTYPLPTGTSEDDVPFPVWWDMFDSWRIILYDPKKSSQNSHLTRGYVLDTEPRT